MSSLGYQWFQLHLLIKSKCSAPAACCGVHFWLQCQWLCEFLRQQSGWCSLSYTQCTIGRDCHSPDTVILPVRPSHCQGGPWPTCQYAVKELPPRSQDPFPRGCWNNSRTPWLRLLPLCITVRSSPASFLLHRNRPLFSHIWRSPH